MNQRIRSAVRARALASVASLCLVASTGGIQHVVASPSQDSSPLIVNAAQAPATLDPENAYGLYDLTILDQTYVRLTQYGTKPGPNGTTAIDASHIVPYFATSWTISKNGMVYTFTLPAGAKFTSGDPMDANAVVYSINKIEGQTGAYFLYDGIYNPPLVKSVAAPNPTTVVITLSQPDANFLQDLAQPACAIFDPAVVKAHGDYQAGKVDQWMASHVAGGGPYMLQSYEPNTRAVLVANPTFFGPPPASKEIIVNFVNSDPTLLLQARSGAADVTLGLSKQSVHSLVGNSNVKIVANDTAVWEQIGLPNNKPPFNNVLFREALTYAVPYQQILKNVAYGYGKLFYGPFPPAFPEFNPKLEAPRPFDLTKAMALIKQSGVPTPVNIQMAIPEGNSNEQAIATVVQGVWRTLGVNVTIQQLAASDYITALETHKVQSYVRYDGPGVLEPGYLMGYDLLCGISYNLSAICIPQADKLLAIARKSTDPVQRQNLWNQIDVLWSAASPKIPVYADQFVTVLNAKVKGYKYSHELDMRTWSK